MQAETPSSHNDQLSTSEPLDDWQQALVESVIQARSNYELWKAEYEELLTKLSEQTSADRLPASFRHGDWRFRLNKGRETQKWEYSQAVETAEMELTAQKEREQRKGEATMTLVVGKPHWSLKMDK